VELPEEDAVAIERPQSALEQNASGVDIAIIRFPRIANFDDFDPLAAEPGVNVRFVDSPANLGKPHAIILPGSKSTAADLNWLHQQGFAAAIEHHRASSGALVGICGGYQMLGQAIHDPQQVESTQSEMRGLGMLEINTIFNPDKATHRVHASVLDTPGWMGKLHDQLIQGYEIHMGTTSSAHPWLRITQRNHKPADGYDGAISADGRAWGCYLHGIFENTSFRHTWLSSLGWSGVTAEMHSNDHRLLHSLERLTDTIEATMDMPRLEALIWED
jgi:adenosylcobyric acid synthase